MDLTSYRTLGRSGLVVSPIALGTMTFGAGRWGADEAISRGIFDAYVEAGGNFADTADVYSGGESEAMLGRFLRERGNRDRMVIATKSGFSRTEGNPLAGGNSARNIRDGLEGSYGGSAQAISTCTGPMSGIVPRHPKRCCAR